MRASIPTLLPLYTYFKILGIDPFDAAQIGKGFNPPRSRAQCQHVFFQHSYNKDFISRERLAEVISEAERMIADVLGFWPAPQYFVDERIFYPRPHQRDLWGGAGTQRGEWKAVQTEWKRFISGGLFNRTAIAAGTGAAVTLNDLDGDNVKESFSVTFPTTLTDPNEIAIYFVSADRLTAPIDETWRIRPVNVTISGGNATITGSSTLLVKPALEETLYPQSLDVTVVGNFAATVDAYRVFTDNAATDSNPNQGVAIWNVLPPTSTTGQISILPLTLAENDNANGMPFATFGAACTWPFNREPDRIQANYVAGLALENGQMQHTMAQAVTYLATSLLATEACGCEDANRLIDYLRKPLSTDDAARLYTLRELEQNPFGAIPSRGNMDAWKKITRWRSVGMVSV